MEIVLAIYALGYIVACIMVSAILTSFLIRDRKKVEFVSLVMSVMIMSVFSWVTVMWVSSYAKNKNNPKEKDEQQW